VLLEGNLTLCKKIKYPGWDQTKSLTRKVNKARQSNLKFLAQVTFKAQSTDRHPIQGCDSLLQAFLHPQISTFLLA
jgi:hypothetical protein